MYFTALEKIIILRANHDGLIKFPLNPGEEEVWLGILLHLEERGYVGRVRGNIPMLPFRLTEMGQTMQHVFAVVVHEKNEHEYFQRNF